jgi:predicted esterase
VRVIEWTFPPQFGQERRAIALVPTPLDEDARLPLLVAMHGWGETTDASIGARGWPESYELVAQMLRLDGEPRAPLTREDFGGLVRPARLESINQALSRRPYRGIVVVCPYVPRDLAGWMTHAQYGQWLAEALVPRARRELPIAIDAASTGIDGVSFGGREALHIGALRGDVFGAVGALQPWIDTTAEALALAEEIAKSIAHRPLRLVTSTEDLYRDTVTTLHVALTKLGVAHEFEMTEGPHDYPWNRGPGAIEMLTWHDRVLRPRGS